MNYVPIRVSTLRGDEKILFDLYVSLGERFVHYARQGSSFEGDRLGRLKKKKVKKMFILEEQESSYQDYVQKNLDMAFDKSKGKSVESRAEIAQGMCEASVEEVLENPQDEVSYNAARNVASKYVKLLIEENSAITTILSIENSAKSLAHHGVTVATLAIGLAQKLGIEDPNLLQHLTMGSYLHDLGHSEADTGFGKKLTEMDTKQKELYLSHPRLGAELAQDKKHFDQEVIDIIMQHEEMEDGSGYPLGLAGSKINRLAKIVGICNTWDQLVTFQSLPVADATKKMMMEFLGKYPLDHIKALQSLVVK